MPIYEYRCNDCGGVFEALQRLADDPLDTCRSCGGSARRIISSPAIRFVGTGWYVTDYAKKGEAKRDGKAPASEKSASKAASEGGGAKPSKEARSGKTKESGGGKSSSSGRGEARAGSPS